MAGGDQFWGEKRSVWGIKGGTCYYVQGGQEGLPEKVTFEQRPGRTEERSFVVMRVGQSFPGSGSK